MFAKIPPFTSTTMQKPWSFRAIELFIYVQIGVTFIVSSYGILFLIVREVLTYGHEFFDQMPVLSQAIISYGYVLWQLLMMSLGLRPMNVASADFILDTAIILFFEFIVSSVILFVLKTKSIVVIRRTAILVLFIKITSGGAIVSSGLPISIFTLCSVFIVAFLSLKPAQYLMVMATATLVRVMTIAFNENQNYPSVGLIPFYSDLYIFFLISVLFTILVVAFLFLKPVQHYIRLRSQQHNNSVEGD